VNYVYILTCNSKGQTVLRDRHGREGGQPGGFPWERRFTCVDVNNITERMLRCDAYQRK